jgi:hypothetical protein
MKIETRQELEKLIATADETNTIVLDEDLKITFDCIIPCNIHAWNIEAYNIKAYNIKAYNIHAWNIDAHNIKYYAFCITYQSLKCKSFSGTRENSIHKCLDQEIEIIKKGEETVTIELTPEQLDKIKTITKCKN